MKAATRAIRIPPPIAGAPPVLLLLDLSAQQRLHRMRIKSGYTAVRVTYATRKLLQMIELTSDEPLDSIIFYMAAQKLRLDFAGLLAAIEQVIPRRGLPIAAQ